jgi:hypothetical protein
LIFDLFKYFFFSPIVNHATNYENSIVKTNFFFQWLIKNKNGKCFEKLDSPRNFSQNDTGIKIPVPHLVQVFFRKK